MKQTRGIRPRAAKRACAGVLLAAWGLSLAAAAAEVEIAVVGLEDGRARPLADAVVSLHRAGAPPPAGGRAVLDQRDSTFVPGVLPVAAGTRVSFPNSDNTLHHVYSFSPAKRFELPLYSGRQAEPVLFDTPGVVVLGCNIHDWMVAHVVVLDTPHFGRTDQAGRVRLQAPPGDYRLRVWHARQGDRVEQALQLPAAGTRRQVRIALQPPVPNARPGASRLLEMQERLRRVRGDGTR